MCVWECCKQECVCVYGSVVVNRNVCVYGGVVSRNVCVWECCK